MGGVRSSPISGTYRWFLYEDQETKKCVKFR
jgi:hypothetical protein